MHGEQGCPFLMPFLCSRVDQNTAAASGSKSTKHEREHGHGWLQRVLGGLLSMAAFRDNSSSKADVDSGAVTHGLK